MKLIIVRMLSLAEARRRGEENDLIGVGSARFRESLLSLLRHHSHLQTLDSSHDLTQGVMNLAARQKASGDCAPKIPHAFWTAVALPHLCL